MYQPQKNLRKTKAMSKKPYLQNPSPKNKPQLLKIVKLFHIKFLESLLSSKEDILNKLYQQKLVNVSQLQQKIDEIEELNQSKETQLKEQTKKSELLSYNLINANFETDSNGYPLVNNTLKDDSQNIQNFEYITPKKIQIQAGSELVSGTKFMINDEYTGDSTNNIIESLQKKVASLQQKLANSQNLYINVCNDQNKNKQNSEIDVQYQTENRGPYQMQFPNSNKLDKFGSELASPENLNQLDIQYLDNKTNSHNYTSVSKTPKTPSRDHSCNNSSSEKYTESGQDTDRESNDEYYLKNLNKNKQINLDGIYHKTEQDYEFDSDLKKAEASLATYHSSVQNQNSQNDRQSSTKRLAMDQSRKIPKAYNIFSTPDKKTAEKQERYSNQSYGNRPVERFKIPSFEDNYNLTFISDRIGNSPYKDNDNEDIVYDTKNLQELEGLDRLSVQTGKRSSNMKNCENIELMLLNNELDKAKRDMDYMKTDYNGLILKNQQLSLKLESIEAIHNEGVKEQKHMKILQDIMKNDCYKVQQENKKLRKFILKLDELQNEEASENHIGLDTERLFLKDFTGECLLFQNLEQDLLLNENNSQLLISNLPKHIREHDNESWEEPKDKIDYDEEDQYEQLSESEYQSHYIRSDNFNCYHNVTDHTEAQESHRQRDLYENMITPRTANMGNTSRRSWKLGNLSDRHKVETLGGFLSEESRAKMSLGPRLLVDKFKMKLDICAQSNNKDNTANIALEENLNSLKQQNSGLSSKIEELEKHTKDLEDKLCSSKNNLNNVNGEFIVQSQNHQEKISEQSEVRNAQDGSLKQNQTLKEELESMPGSRQSTRPKSTKPKLHCLDFEDCGNDDIQNISKKKLQVLEEQLEKERISKQEYKENRDMLEIKNNTLTNKIKNLKMDIGIMKIQHELSNNNNNNMESQPVLPKPKKSRKYNTEMYDSDNNSGILNQNLDQKMEEVKNSMDSTRLKKDQLEYDQCNQTFNNMENENSDCKKIACGESESDKDLSKYSENSHSNSELKFLYDCEKEFDYRVDLEFVSSENINKISRKKKKSVSVHIEAVTPTDQNELRENMISNLGFDTIQLEELLDKQDLVICDMKTKTDNLLKQVRY